MITSWLTEAEDSFCAETVNPKIKRIIDKRSFDLFMIAAGLFYKGLGPTRKFM
jgi:hypothetical protein